MVGTSRKCCTSEHKYVKSFRISTLRINIIDNNNGKNSWIIADTCIVRVVDC